MFDTQPLEVDFKSMGELLDIGVVSSRSGLAPSALRYYEREGLITSVERSGLRRQYRPEVLTTLAVVVLCRQSGFSLDEIRALLATRGERTWKRFAARKRDELRAQAEQLSGVADQLDHALHCPSPNVFDCEHFQAVLGAVLPAPTERGVSSTPSAPARS